MDEADWLDDYPEDMDEYYDEEEEIDMGRGPCKEFIHNVPWENDVPRIHPPRLEVKGDLSGDLDWNNIEAIISLVIPAPTSVYTNEQQELRKQRYGTYCSEHMFSVQVSPFTRNCGIKALHHVDCQTENMQAKKKFLEYVESFLYYCCNCGIVVGSDFLAKDDDLRYYGSSGRFLKEVGTNWTFTAPVWNPNYKNTSTHQVYLFYKYLDAKTLLNYWG